MPTLSARERRELPDRAFAYIDREGSRRLPINDEGHVRAALARFNQVQFEDDDARAEALKRLLLAARKYRIVPIGFMTRQMRPRAGSSAKKSKLPTGRVTLLFTDIEASTALLEMLGDGYIDILNDVRSLMRDAVGSAGGAEVDARADEFFAAFRRPAQALAAAVAIQRGLQGRAWPDDIQVCVRVGIHTGRTTLAETGYVGIAVHTASRVCSAGHGGQILLSTAARDAMDVARSDGITFRTLGRYTLAGLPEPEGLFQVNVTDLRVKFPKLRAAVVRAGGPATRRS